jgi:hypothetical protein
LPEDLRDRYEVLLVVGDQHRVGPGGEVSWKVKSAGAQGDHIISSRWVPGSVDDSVS